MNIIYKYNINLDLKQIKIIKELQKVNEELYKKIYNENIKKNDLSYENLYNKYKKDENVKYINSSIYIGCIKNVYTSLINKNEKKYIPIIYDDINIIIENSIIKLNIDEKIKSKFNIKNLKIKLNDKDICNILKVEKKNNKKSIKSVNKSDKKLMEFMKNENIVQRVSIYIKNNSQIILIIRYTDKSKYNKNNNIVAIDLGVSNLAACTNLKNENTILINGGPLKSMNRFVNNKIFDLQIMEYRRLRAENKKKNIESIIDKNQVYTKRIKKLQTYRTNYINTYMQKAANEIIKYSIDNDANSIVIGYVRDVIQNNRYVDNFVPVPIQDLEKELLKRTKKLNIKLYKISESYTSGCSSLDLEKLNKFNYNKRRRIVRGIFKSNKGIYINSDINGSLNILRKFIDRKYINNYDKEKLNNMEKIIPKMIEISSKQGYVKNPIKINL